MKLIFKKSQLKSIFIFMLVLLVALTVASAMTIRLNSPATLSWWTSSSSVDHNFTVWINSSTESIDWCAILSNRSGTWATLANYTSGITNGTHFVRGISWVDTDNNSAGWNVTCYNGSQINSTSTFNLGVDSNAPTITLDSPSDDSYTNINTSFITYTPSDSSNLDTCLFYANNTGTWAVNQTNTSCVSGTQIEVNITIGGGILSDGVYIWNVVCNDSAKNTVWAEDTNRTLTIDTVSPTDIKFISPSNHTTDSNTSLLVKWNKTTDINFQKYVVYVATNHTNFSFTIIQEIEITNVSANSTILTSLPVDNQYYIMVTAIDEADNMKNITTGALWYTVDTTVPVVVLNAPSNNTHTTDTTPDINVTVTDDNPDTCLLYLTSNNGSISTLTLNKSKTGIISGTETNLTTTTLIDGNYKFVVTCNDSDNNRVNSSGFPYNLTIDTTFSTQLNLTSTWHQTNSTDKTPLLKWDTVNETNFDKYVVEATYVHNGSIHQQINITTRTRNYTSFNLSSATHTTVNNHTYNFSVKAYDLAGNSVKSTNNTDSWYYVDGVCADLQAGWNLCGIVSTTARNLSVIGAEAGASFVSVWNTSKAWKTCNVAVGTTNCHIDVAITNTDLHHVWIYMSIAGVWENRTWAATNASANITLSNVSTNGWNIMGQYLRNGLTFEQLNDTSKLGIGENVSMYSKPYNNGTLNSPFVTIKGYDKLNKNIRLEYGEAMWVFYNETGGTSNIYNVGVW